MERVAEPCSPCIDGRQPRRQVRQHPHGAYLQAEPSPAGTAELVQLRQKVARQGPADSSREDTCPFQLGRTFVGSTPFRQDRQGSHRSHHPLRAPHQHPRRQPSHLSGRRVGSGGRQRSRSSAEGKERTGTGGTE